MKEIKLYRSYYTETSSKDYSTVKSGLEHLSGFIRHVSPLIVYLVIIS